MPRGRLVICGVIAAVFGGFAVGNARADVTWCGHDEVSASRKPDLVLGQTIRFVYAVPADAPDRFLQYASGIATDAAAIDAWWRTQDPTRTPRFDRFAFPGCPTTFGDLDIGFIRLPKPESAYATDLFNALWLDLSAVLPTDQRTVVYYDGTAAGDTGICGREFSVYQYNLAAVYLQQQTCDILPLGHSHSSWVAAHELLHDLGAVDARAPHACQNQHVCDAKNDIMYPQLQWGLTLPDAVLDVGHDDYYAHTASLPDVQDSQWLEHLPERMLRLQTAGQGHVVAAGAAVTGCESGCTIDSSPVALTAVPDSGWSIRWSGACTGSAETCTLPESAALSVTATFVPAPVVVHVAVHGRGTVRSTPGGMACSSSCRATFAAQSSVRLTASPAPGWRFAGWSGDCSGSACAVADGADVVATFAKKKR